MNAIVFDYSKLRGRIKEKFGNQTLFAKQLGISHVSLSAKLNNKVGFNQSEISSSCKLLSIDVSEIREYFFKEEVQKTEQNLT